MQNIEKIWIDNHFMEEFHVKHFFRLIISLFCFAVMMISGRSAEAGMISEKQELDMGKAAAEQIEAHYGVLNDPQINERVNRIGQSLVDVCGRKNIKYTFKVLNTEDVNALACPGRPGSGRCGKRDQQKRNGRPGQGQRNPAERF